MPPLARALSRQQEKLDHCVHCGFCLPACPTYVRLGDENDSPRGRLYLMRAVVEGRLDPGDPAYQLHIDRCLGCRACETVCPSGVEYGILLERARAEAIQARRPGVLTRAVLAVFRRPPALRLSLLLARALRWTRLPRFLARRLSSAGWAGRARFGMAMLAATERGGGEGALPDGGEASGSAGVAARAPAAAEDGSDAPTLAAVLKGCVQEGLFSRVNRATERVLRANGHRVADAPGQGCCGALHAHAGDLEGARVLARRNIAAFEASEAERIVVNAAGCGAVMKEYGVLLADDAEWAERAREVAARTVDVSEALAERGPRRGGPVALRVAYDAPCHLLHGQRVSGPPLRVLGAVEGLELVPLRDSDECCGGAGLYGITHPELGGRIGADKVAAVRESEADAVATGNPGCMMQIGAEILMRGVRVGVWHPVELLDEGYRRAGVYGREGGDR